MNSTPHRSNPLVPERPATALAVPELVDVMQRGQTLEREGRPHEARAIYEGALDDGTATGPAGVAQLMRWIARTHIQESRFESARDHARAALVVSERARDEAGRGHAENILAIVEWKLSNLDEAERLYHRAHACALIAGESRLATMTASNLGVIASVRGDDAEAHRHFETALASARSAGLADQAIAALINLGLHHTHLRRYPEAERALLEARELAAVLGDVGASITVELDVAKLRVHQQRYLEARECCQRARDTAERTGTTQAEGDTALVQGLIAHALGEMTDAEAHFLRAEEIAVERSDMILEGETSRELAALYREQGRNRQTLQRLNQSHRLFSQLRARRELADVDRRMGLLEGDFIEVVRKWGESIESKDIYTQGHCVRVADLSCALWERVAPGDATSFFWFRIGALLHDVGKLMVPAEVLNKPGRLNEEEWALVRRHPSAGVELLADIEFPWDVLPIVESHHERWDGTGYPHGLAGTAIPLTARVVCIADVYDALTSKRSYKERMTHDAAMTVMRKDAGTAFDPDLFVQFEAIVSEGSWYDASTLSVVET